jgi:DNA-directed RNA polymerase beta' subunit
VGEIIMKLELLNINDYVENNKLKPITTIRLYEKVEKTDPNGLFSEEIFGRFGSTERRKKFAYIDLKTTVIHPEAFQILTGLDASISKLLTNKMQYIVDDKGFLIEDPQNGSSGISYFISIFKKLDIEKFAKTRPKNVKFVKDNKDKIFINKYLVLPAGIRDLSISKTSNQTIVNFSDLSELYTNLIRHTNTLGSNIESLPDEIKNPITEQIQKTILEINNWIKNRLKGKSGLIRGGLLRKVIDYSGRLVITTDNTIPLGYVGLPWSVVLKLYEPFAINYILKKDQNMLKSIQYLLKSETPLDVNDLKKFFAAIINKPEIIPEDMVDYFIHVAEAIIKDKVVIYKRDPVENRDSWLAANVKVNRTGMCLALNPFDLLRTGADHDGDAVAVVSLFTKEAQNEAKTKMHPNYAESMWTSVTSANKCPYSITLDALTAIYAATK